MKRRIFHEQMGPLTTQRPEQQLQFLSMTEELQAQPLQQRKNQHKWQIEPWRNQHENPSESPERRPFTQKSLTTTPKVEKPLQIQLNRTSIRALKACDNFNTTFRTKTSKKTVSQKRIHQENVPQNRTVVVRGRSSVHKPIFRDMGGLDDEEEESNQYSTKINPILYPMITDCKKKRLFRKMDKFQNFVSVSLRK